MLKHNLSAAVILASAVIGCSTSANNSAAPKPDVRAPITDFGAVADGKTINTKAIQAAIDHLASSGGGTVVVPAGKFLSGAIFLKPGVNLHVDKDGVLAGSQDINDFPIGPTRIEGHFQDWLPALVNADHCDHVRIDGPGTLDGRGQPFWTDFYSRRTANPQTTNLDVKRPRLVFIRNSSDVEVRDLRFHDSAFWNLHLYDCNHVLVDNIDISISGRGPSTDGMDVDSCQYINIHGCSIQNNDDGIALKGSKGPLAMDDKSSPPDEHIHVSDCKVTAGGSLLTCGSEATIVRDVLVEHCSVGGPNSGGISMLRLKLRPDTPQQYSDIHFNDITLVGSGSIINVAPWRQYFDLQGHAPPARSIHGVTISNVHGTFTSFGSIQGNPATASNPADSITDISFEDMDVKVRTGPGRMGVASGLVYKNVTINGKPYPAPAAAAPAAQAAPPNAG
jgi:alpha-L-rhamnosidase